MIKVSAGCPTLDGTDYPYWKNKMRMHLEAIDNDLWYVVENGVPSVTPTINAADVKRFKQLDSQAKNIICGHLSKGHTTKKRHIRDILGRTKKIMSYL